MNMILLTLFNLLLINTERVELGYYWAANEAKYPQVKNYPIPKCNSTTNEPLLLTSKEFASDLIYQGSGKLINGSFINCMNERCDCFDIVPGALGSGGKLNKFSSITFNKYANKTKVFVPNLAGYKLPNGGVHNGCLIIDDSCFNCNPNRVKLFVEEFENYEMLKRDLGNEVELVANSNCEPITY